MDFNSAEARDIAHSAESNGWQVAAHDHMRSLNRRAYRLAVDEYSGQLRFLLPLTTTSRVLQVRSGWGSVALNVATSVGSVVAMDDRPERLRFLAMRRNEVGADTLETMYGKLGHGLPFSNGEFDAVIVLDALEHIGSTRAAARGKIASSRWKQEHQAIVEAYRVLKSGGRLLLGVPNRLGFARPHSNEAERLHTYFGYRRLLCRAGFKEVEFYAPLPSHLEPFFILPLERSRLLGNFVDWMFTAQDYRSKLEARGFGAAYRLAWGLWRTGRRLKLTGIVKYVVPSYLIVAGK